MDEHVQSFRLQHKALIKQFYITSSTQNLEKLYQNALNSKDDEIVEEFIKLCCISVDRTNFKNYLTNIIEHFVWLGLKYYDEMDGYDEARTIIENEAKGLEIEDEAISILAQDVEYRVKELCQEAAKFMLFSKRTKLSIDDVNNALTTRNVDPIFGYDPKDNLVFKNDIVKSAIFYVPDEEIDLEDLLNQPPPKMPLKPKITSHWLAIEGVQPQIPQNPIIMEKPSLKQDPLVTYTEESELKQTTKHVISKELQLYYEKILSFLEDSEKITLAIECLKTESGIQQLIPYLIQNINEKILKNMESEVLSNFILFYHSLLQNEHIFIDPYLHQIIPSLLTCIIGKRIKNMDIRKLAAETIKYVYDKYSITYDTLGPRIIKTLSKVWLDKDKSEDAHYAALFTLSILSTNVISSVIQKEKDRYVEMVKDLNYENVLQLLNDILAKS